jgi:hypothetical protein
VDQTLWIVWAVLFAELAALGFVACSFSLRTLRLFTGVTAFILAIAVTRFGLLHPEYSPTHPNLVDSFLSGVDQVTIALLHPLWPGHVPVPGVAGRWIIAVALLLGYRQLEASARRRQAPELDLSAIGEETANSPGATADATPRSTGATASGPTDEQRRQLAVELRFRLPTMEVRAPAILPGGSRANALASIAESSGVSGAGLVSAVFRLASLFWPCPRRLRVRVRLESVSQHAGPRITVLLEDTRSGLTAVTKTVTGDTFDEATSMAAGYIARQVFAMDPTVPDWCYGLANGQDLGAMQLVRLARVYAACSHHVDESREEQILVLSKWTGNARSAGIVRYELAQLLALRGQHLESLRLHATNRELHPRFYRGRYRLAMSLEMITNPEHFLPEEEPDKEAASKSLLQTLQILYRCVLPQESSQETREYQHDNLEASGKVTHCMRPTPDFALKLLEIATADLREVRRQLTAWKVVLDAIIHRDEREVWLPHWRRRRRQAFHDGVCVAELFIEMRCSLLKRDKRDPLWREGSRMPANTPPERAAPSKPGKPKLPRHQRRAIKITSFIAGDRALIRAVLAQPDGVPSKPDDWWAVITPAARPAADRAPRARVRWLPSRHRRDDPRRRKPRRGRDRVRWLPGQRCTASWQAAYNTACLYAALADVAPAPARGVLQAWVIASLRRAMDNPDSELERSSDWIDNDPDFNYMKQHEDLFTGFKDFREELRLQDYPAACPAGMCPVPSVAGAGNPDGHGVRHHPIVSPVPGRVVARQSSPPVPGRVVARQ